MNQLRPPTVQLRLLILGYGSVAQAFLPLLASRQNWLERESGQTPLICGLGSRTQGLFVHSEGISADVLVQQQNPVQLFQTAGARTDSAHTFIQVGRDVGANVFIELTTLNPENGLPALDYIRRALTHGMHVITANKGPIAHALDSLQAQAHYQHLQLRLESTVMDGL